MRNHTKILKNALLQRLKVQCVAFFQFKTFKTEQDESTEYEEIRLLALSKTSVYGVAEISVEVSMLARDPALYIRRWRSKSKTLQAQNSR